MRTTLHSGNRLFIALTAFFLVNALLAEFVGVKIFSLEATLGRPPVHWQLFGVGGALDFTAGVLLWPFVFIMTDVINEYYGVRGVRFISWLAVGCISYAFVAAYAVIALAGGVLGAPMRRWRARHPARVCAHLRQGMWTIGGSLVAS